MNALKKQLGLFVAIAFVAFAATAATLPLNFACSAKATATSEFSGQYLAQFAVDGKIPEAGSKDDLGQAWCVRGDTHRNGAETRGVNRSNLTNCIEHTNTYYENISNPNGGARLFAGGLEDAGRDKGR